jgi:hypothetical protein
MNYKGGAASPRQHVNGRQKIKKKKCRCGCSYAFFYHISCTGGLGEAALPEKVALHLRGSTRMSG